MRAAETGNSVGSGRATATADWKVQGADGGSGHGGDGSWKAQGTAAAEAVAGRLRASLGGERM